MAIEVKHTTQATGTDAGNGEIRKAQWNESHQLNMATGALLGRSTAGAGAAEEIAIGSGLSLSGGTLSASGGGSPTTYTASVPSGSWTGTGPSTQTVTVSGLTATDTMILDLDLSAAAYSAVAGLQTAYALVYRAVPGTNQVVLYASSAPATSFNIYVTVI